MTYRVFDTSINRLFGTFDSEEEALALVRSLVGANEDDFAADLELSCEQADGSFGEPLTGAALIARAEEVAAGLEAVLAGSGKAATSNPR